MSSKNTMQLINLGLSIMNKVQTMQHRQLRISNEIKRKAILDQKTNRDNRQNLETILDAEVSTSALPQS